jgi:hypothetical protein
MQQLARKGWGREYIQNVARAIIFPHNVDLSIHLPPAGIPRSFLFVFLGPLKKREEKISPN